MKTTSTPMASALVLLCTSSGAFSAPSTPSLSFLHYSDTAAELFWTRSTSDAGGLLYKVTRNGELVFSGDALSFFDSSLIPDSTYRYTLIVSDATGSQSPPVSVDFSSEHDTPATPLRAPSGFRAAVYSSSALELFWNRDNSQTLTYEVIQDGVSLGTTDGTSFYISSGVQRNTQYQFEVIAQRNDSSSSQSSAPALLDVSLNTTNPADTPSIPANPSIERYSRTTAELFWDRAAAEEQIVSTEVYRNGEFLGSTHGTSFLDRSRSDGNSYLYTLFSVNTNGVRSGGAQVSEEALSEFVINSDNLDDVLFTVAALVNAAPFDNFVQIANNFAVGNVEGLELLSAEQGVSSRARVSTYGCETAGGTLIQTTVDRGGLSTLNIAVANNCAFNGLTYSGQVEQEAGTSTLLSVNDFTVANDDRTVVRLNASAQVISGSIDVRGLSASSYEEFDVNGMVSTSITDYSTSVVDQNLTSSFTANISGFPEFTVTTLTDFSPALGRQDNLLTGILRVVFADNGPILTIDASNGDPASFTVTVETSASSISYTVDWTLANRFFLAFGS